MLLDAQLSHISEVLRRPNIEDLAERHNEDGSVIPAVPIKQKVGLLKAVTLLLSNDVLIPHLEETRRSAIRLGLLDQQRLTGENDEGDGGATQNATQNAPAAAAAAAAAPAKDEGEKKAEKKKEEKKEEEKEEKHPEQQPLQQQPPDVEQLWTDLSLAASEMRRAYHRFLWRNRAKLPELSKKDKAKNKEDMFDAIEDGEFTSEDGDIPIFQKLQQMKKQSETEKAKISELEARPVIELSLNKLTCTKYTSYIQTNYNLITGYSGNSYGNMAIGDIFTTVCILILFVHPIFLCHRVSIECLFSSSTSFTSHSSSTFSVVVSSSGSL